MRITIAVLTLLIAAVSLAETADVRFIPPAPESRSAVTARISGVWSDAGYPRCAEASVSSRTITIVADCQPEGAIQVVSPWSLDVFVGQLEAGVYDVEVRLSSGTVLGRSSLAV